MKHVLLFLLRIYQHTISPDHGWFSRGRITPRCRFYPTCSAYAIQSIERFGAWKGMRLTIKRVGRCHPWHPGGVDEVPER